MIIRRNRFVDLRRRFADSPVRALQNARHRFDNAAAILRVLGPDATLRRGYSITSDKAGKVIRTVAAVRSGMKIHSRVSDGEFGSEVF